MTADNRNALIERLADFASATDRRDWATLAAMLTPDAIAYGAEGPDAVVARMQGALGGVGPSQHLLGNHRVSIDGDQARTLTYGRVHHVGAGPMEGSFFECLGEYDDQWVRSSGSWLLRRRHFDMQITMGDWAVLRPA